MGSRRHADAPVPPAQIHAGVTSPGSTGDLRSISGQFFVEDKNDGVRGQMHCDSDHLAIYPRTLDEITDHFPELHAALLALPGSFILNGEVLAARDGQILSFRVLQNRLGRKTVGADLLTETPVIFRLGSAVPGRRVATRSAAGRTPCPGRNSPAPSSLCA